MSLKAALQSAVNDLFSAFDDLVGPLVLRKVYPGSYDPTIGKVTSSEIDFATTGAFDDVNSSTFNSTLVEAGDKVVYIKPLTDAEPNIGDKIVDPNAIEYTIIDRMDFRSYDTTFAWQLLVRV